MPRVFYFDIDGTLLDYSDEPKPALAGDALQRLLQERAFDRLVCVSGWAEMAQAPVLGISPDQRTVWLHQLVAAIFPDRDRFIRTTDLLAADTDHRCAHIDRNQDWWYADDWAREFAEDAWGPAFAAAEASHRIFPVDPHGDGSDLLEWLRRVE